MLWQDSTLQQDASGRYIGGDTLDQDLGTKSRGIPRGGTLGQNFGNLGTVPGTVSCDGTS